MHLAAGLFSDGFQPILYLDPGSGSLVLQVVIAAFLGVGMFVRAQWNRIKKIVGKGRNQTSNSDPE